MADDQGTSTEPRPEAPFPIVGIGASAGGVRALKEFFGAVPGDAAMAFIVLVHLARDQSTSLPDIIARECNLSVEEVEDGVEIERGHVYVAPPGREISLYEGTIQVYDRESRHPNVPIDVFLRSLAQDRGEQAAGVILSGTGTDGTLGIKEVYGESGLVVVQSTDSAEYHGMPQSAIDTGLADLVLDPSEMYARIAEHFRVRRTSGRSVSAEAEGREEWLTKIFVTLRSHVGHDFSAYKENTIRRRIARRMAVHHIDSPDDYVKFLRENEDETQALFREVLIGVTRFFRDEEVFDLVKRDILSEGLRTAGAEEAYRVWVPGCSTGEEAFSIAMLVQEAMQGLSRPIDVQVFATDIDDHAIDVARSGLYPESIAADVSKERLHRFFVKEGNRYRVRREVRDTVVFSVQDVLRDPPFSRLDLLSCRNLLIYLKPEKQKQLLPMFHFALNPGGALVLGTSESLGEYARLYDPIEPSMKVFRRADVDDSERGKFEFPVGSRRTLRTEHTDRRRQPRPRTQEAGGVDQNLGVLVQQVVNARFAPSCVLVEADGTILYIVGRTGEFLEQSTGQPSQDIVDLARSGLRLELSSALREARTSEEIVVRRDIQVKTNGETQPTDLHVIPLHRPRPLSGRFLVVFEKTKTPEPAAPPDSTASEDEESVDQALERRIAELEKELKRTEENHQATVEELESANEELKSTNEELQSSNEELQSTSEENESSREELQSLNEELQTKNAELETKLGELEVSENDMRNLLNSTEVATIFVNNDAEVRRFTPKATEIVNLVEEDQGRPLRHLSHNLVDTDLVRAVEAVLDDLSRIEREVRTEDGRWYALRVIPYRTSDNRIDGAVLTFFNIDQQKERQEELHRAKIESDHAWSLVRSVYDMNPEALAVLDDSNSVVIANDAFRTLMQHDSAPVEGREVFELRGGILDNKDLRSKLESALSRDEDFESMPFELSGGRRFTVRGRVVRSSPDLPYRVLLSFYEE